MRKLFILATLTMAQPAFAQSIVTRTSATPGETGVVAVPATAGAATKVPAMVPVKQDGTPLEPLESGGTVTVTGVATAAKQPALGVAGTPSADVISVQGPQLHGAVFGSGLSAMGCFARDSAPAIEANDDIVHVHCTRFGGLLAVGSNAANVPWGHFQSLGNGVAAPTSVTPAQMVVSYPVNWNGTNYDKAPGDVNGTVSQPHALTANRWQYAAASGGIVNSTTGVTVAVAVSGVRNYVTSIQCDSDVLGAATEVTINDGASGTTIWRGGIPTSGWLVGRQMTFPVPLKGSVNTLVELKLTTASVTGGVRCNVQGYTAL